MNYNCEKCRDSGTVPAPTGFEPCPDCNCLICQGSQTVEEPVCAYCVEGVEHSSCDDTWLDTIECPACVTVVE